jgi:hypothetical protein
MSYAVDEPGAGSLLPTPPRRGPAAPRAFVAIAFGVAFAWDLVEAIANLVALLAFAAAAGHPLNSYAWLVLGAGILAPPALYVTALALAGRLGPLRLAAVLAAALATSACIALTLEALLRA